MVGILLSYWDGLFSGAMLVSGGVLLGAHQEIHLSATCSSSSSSIGSGILAGCSPDNPASSCRKGMHIKSTQMVSIPQSVGAAGLNNVDIDPIWLPGHPQVCLMLCIYCKNASMHHLFILCTSMQAYHVTLTAALTHTNTHFDRKLSTLSVSSWKSRFHEYWKQQLSQHENQRSKTKHLLITMSWSMSRYTQLIRLCITRDTKVSSLVADFGPCCYPLLVEVLRLFRRVTHTHWWHLSWVSWYSRSSGSASHRPQLKHRA